MEWLNYHHLLYFWMVAREGGLVPAARRLGLAHTTVSEQIHALEAELHEKLFVRQGRKLVLTDVGRIAYRYADEIFTIGRELSDTVKKRPTGKPLRLVVGVADAVPKLIAHRLLLPACKLDQPVRLVCKEDKSDRLLAELALHSLDVVLSDAPVGAGTNIRAFSHLLGESAVSFFAGRRLARRLEAGFPRSLDGQPMLMPADNTALRRALEQWFEAQGIRPECIAEFDDSALLKAFALDGTAVFAAPSVIETEIERQYRVRCIARATDLRERFYAITVERRIKHPAVLAISQAARGGLT